MKHVFPFSAIVGQDEMKRALILTAIDPGIGGVLVFGDRGTGKSTAVRALAALLPTIEAAENCPYNCTGKTPENCPHCRENTGATRAKSGTAKNAKGKPTQKRVKIPTPVIDLPLGATEDRVVGALDVERALTDGKKVFEPGLLARANRGYLYIDEANLLEDHLVDLLLDVAQSGENLVEREGLSIRHDAKFVLIGSGNPEEGELRPQLLDRFGLSVDVASPAGLDERVEVIKRRDAFDRDPSGFVANWKKQDDALRKKITAAQKAVAAVATPDEILRDCARLCIALGSDGLRGELTLLRSARAHAAFEGRDAITREDILTIATSALRHRLRRDPLDDAGSTARVERIIADVFA